LGGPGPERENQIEKPHLETQSAKRNGDIGHEHFIITELEAGLDAIPQPAPPGLQQLPQLESNCGNKGMFRAKKECRVYSLSMAFRREPLRVNPGPSDRR
jgi:hypothetical protein